MSDEALTVSEDARAPFDERRLAAGIAIGLPLVTLAVAAVVGVMIGAATSILVLAAGALLGVIALLWESLRILSGDAELSPEIEALDMASQGGDALASRKKMLLRALRDLDNERAIGKMEDEDYEQLSSTYRAELKAVLKRIDASLAPHRIRAEVTASSYLARIGLAEGGAFASTRDDTGSAPPNASVSRATATARSDARVTCPSCGESNEADAKFCKECAKKLAPGSGSSKEPSSTSEGSDDA